MALQRSEFGLVWSNWFDFHHLVLISWRCGFNVYCACQVQLRSHAALRPYTASPESAENYSTTCQFYCVVITQSHQQTVRIPCLLCWCGGVNLRSGEMSSSSFSQFNTLLCAFIAGAGNCLSLQSVVAARLLCMLCCRGSSVDASWAAATASWFEVKPWRCSLVPGVALSARTFSSPCLYRPLFLLSPYSCVVVVPPPALPASRLWRHMQVGDQTTQSCTNWAFFVPGHSSVPRHGDLGGNPSSTREPNWIDNVGT